ncbi:hypothetical protein AAHC03_09572 [Spirometra sp. Aus1]
MSSAAGKGDMDGLLLDDEQSLRDRVTYLEKKVAEQAEDLACMKSAIADCIRRMGQLESTRGTYPTKLRSQSHGPVAKTTASDAYATTPLANPSGSRPRMPRNEMRRGPGSLSGASPRRPIGTSQSVNEVRAAPQSARPTNQATTPTQQPKSIKSPGVVSRHAVAGTVSGAKASAREPSYQKEEGILRLFLRGRGITVYAPTEEAADYDFSEVVKPPEEQLKLEWVYGYRGKDCRNNVHLLPTGEIVYFVAAVVVLYNVEQHSQRHYLEHNDDVKCLTVHPDRITVASGQTAGHSKDGMPHVRVWNSVSLETLQIIGLGAFENSVCCLSFSKTDSGAMLVVVDEAPDHNISLWDWQKARRMTETKCSTEPVTAAEFAPLDENTLVTIGKSHIAFWTYDGSTLSKKSGVFDKYEKPKFILCMAFAENGDLLTGDSNGQILIWPRGGTRISHAITGAHTGGIFALCFTKEGTLISGGGKDYRMVEYDSAYNPTGLVVEISAWYGPVRTLVSGPGGTIFVSTTQSTILHGKMGEEFTALVQGHSDEFWALATHPQTHHFLTSGKDGNIFLWDSLTKNMVWAENLSEEVSCADFYPAVASRTANENGDAEGAAEEGTGTRLPDSVPVFVVGTNAGRWIVLDATLHQIIAAHSESSEPVQCIAFSPNGQYVAIGCRDNLIYVYNVLENGFKYTRLGKCSGHSSFVLHLDWSEDSQYLRTTSGDYELLYWTVSNCRQVTAVSSLRDVRWATQTCQLGWAVAGIWPPGSDGTDINAVARSHSTRLLATADDFGKVNLFRYPCSHLNSKCHTYGGHSSHVTNVQFLFDDSRLISAGGADTAVLQWEVFT